MVCFVKRVRAHRCSSIGVRALSTYSLLPSVIFAQALLFERVDLGFVVMLPALGAIASDNICRADYWDAVSIANVGSKIKKI